MPRLPRFEELHHPDLRLYPEDSRTESTPKDYFDRLTGLIESIEISPFVHPDAERYLQRVLEVFLRGYFYYPLFTIADMHSVLALELALRKRYWYQAGEFDLSLGKLFKRALSDGSLDMTKTQQVLRMYKKHIEHMQLLEQIRDMDLSDETRSIQDIGKGRGKVLARVLPNLRGYSVHPNLPSLVMPQHAARSIRSVVEYINLIFMSVGSDLRRISGKRGVNWEQLEWNSEHHSMEYDLQRIPINMNNGQAVCLSEVCDLIQSVSDCLGIRKRGVSSQFWIHNQLRILPTKSFDSIYPILKLKEEARPGTITDPKQIDLVRRLEKRYIDVLYNFHPDFKLVGIGASLHCVLCTTKDDKRYWRLDITCDGRTSHCRIKETDLVYYLLLRIGLHGTDTGNPAQPMRELAKLIGGVSLSRQQERT